MANKVTLHDSFIELVFIGDQTEKTVRSISEKARRLSEKQWKGDPTLVLVNLYKMGKSSFTSRSAALEALNAAPFIRMAVYANSVFLRHVAELIIRAARMGEKIRIFTAREEAVRWLTGGNHFKTE
ncbi:MAG: STAS/SEC14 domain-containing protein [Candidatus Berkelbacteria bacterium]|nr:MAG: STAS/SEC14 domain-containing protein [Candidatus Berkelbacteria bacterium]QQG51991.1 MAG: STAS/SEC14 domain-containing protein [Candidatus Berkelbacteria bacterium]